MSTTDSNHPAKDNPVTFNTTNCTNRSRNSDQLFMNNCNQFKPNRLSACLSVPNYSYSCPQKTIPRTANIILNRPASFEDILKSARKSVEESKAYCQLDENFDLRPEELANDSAYISRKAVENVLNLQKLQRQRSVSCKGGHIFVGQRNSSSSLESLDNVFVLRDKAPNMYPSSKLEFVDVINIARRRDSGNWSGDRSSASSSSTTSLDNPYLCALGKR